MSRRLPGLRGRQVIARRWYFRSGRQLVSDWDLPMGEFTVRLPGDSLQTWTVAFCSAYGTQPVAALLGYIVPGSLVLDIGASLGLVTVQLAAAARERGAQVVAYEPVPRNTTYLLSNVARNGLGDVVTLRAIALGREEGTIDMRVEGSGAGNALVVVDRADGRPPAPTAASVSVPLRRLDDDLATRERPCSAIKIDVEGFEMDLLAGAESVISSDRPAIYAEFSRAWMRRRGVAIPSVWEWAAAHDYDVFHFPLTRSRPWEEASFGAPERTLDTTVPGELLLLPRGRDAGGDGAPGRR